MLSSSKLKVLGAFVFIPLRCSSRVACRGRFSIHTTARVGKHHKRQAVLCAAASYKLRAHQQKQVKARISGLCVALLAHARGKQLLAQLTAQLGTGQLGVTRGIRLTR